MKTSPHKNEDINASNTSNNLSIFGNYLAGVELFLASTAIAKFFL